MILKFQIDALSLNSKYPFITLLPINQDMKFWGRNWDHQEDHDEAFSRNLVVGVEEIPWFCKYSYLEIFVWSCQQLFCLCGEVKLQCFWDLRDKSSWLVQQHQCLHFKDLLNSACFEEKNVGLERLLNLVFIFIDKHEVSMKEKILFSFLLELIKWDISWIEEEFLHPFLLRWNWQRFLMYFLFQSPFQLPHVSYFQILQYLLTNHSINYRKWLKLHELTDQENLTSTQI